MERSQQDQGLASADIPALRNVYGFNELPVRREDPVLAYLKNFWGPLPWLMELLVLINFFSNNSAEALIILALLLINSGISTLQRRSTEAALRSLTQHLTVFARVRRDAIWRSVATRELLPGDVIRVRGGDITPADATILEGAASIDLSSLTGESLPRDTGVSETIFSGSVVRRGEATARVIAIGAKTMYGKTTELLETSHPPTHMEHVIFAVIRFFFFWNIALAIVVVAYGLSVHAAWADIVNFVIVLLLTSVPIAFPTMFAVAQSYGALQMSTAPRNRTLVRRLAAVQECATVDVLCSDKTGTLTMNQLKATELTRYGSNSETRLLSLAVACSDESDRDPIDNAIIELAHEREAPTLKRMQFTPFNSQTKRTQAEVNEQGTAFSISMGLPELLLTEGVAYEEEAKRDLLRMSAKGLRVLAVVEEKGNARQCAGLIGLSDPLRSDAARMLEELRTLGVRIVIITGDGRTTAHAVAASLGLPGQVATPAELRADPSIATKTSVFAETYPEDKLTIIRALQNAGHTVAMTGDGVNDAPALHQAEVGIAVATATDVAKQSASFILTDDGLEGVIAAIVASRGVYVRLRTWTLNKIIKSFEVSTFTAILFLVTHSYIFSPLLAVLLIFANDFVTIAIATDHAKPTPAPGRWQVTHLALGAVALAVAPWLALTCIYLIAQKAGYSIGEMRSVIYLTLVWCGIGTLYAIRSWPHAWTTLPSGILVLATSFSLLFSLGIAGFGIFTPAVPPAMMASIFLAALFCFLLTDALKSAPIVRRLIVGSN